MDYRHRSLGLGRRPEFDGDCIAGEARLGLDRRPKFDDDWISMEERRGLGRGGPPIRGQTEKKE